ncbi:MAG TPA: hypothetical protein VD908_12540 [Cytophagales bacterium]|nr:hypothetical protein [Cytophagales bacterium]
MEKKDIPQDPSKLQNFTKEVCYAVDETGKYVADLSSGWEVKSSALEVAWNDIDTRVSDAKQKMDAGQASPVLYLMELKLMDLPTVSDYTGFWKWTIKRHFKPNVFGKLSDNKLKRYAEVFEVSVEDLKKMNKG